MNTKMQNVMLGVLIAGLVGLTVAYSSLSAQLTINNSADINAKWEVIFQNISSPAEKVGVPEPTVTGNAIIDPLDSTKIKDLDVTFTAPGQSVSYTFDIKNNGTIPAKISGIDNGTISCKIGNTAETVACAEIEYSLVYTGTNTPVANGQIFNPEASKNVTLTISFDADKSLESVPTGDIVVSGLTSEINFVQSDALEN